MISYDNKGFILALVLHIHTDKVSVSQDTSFLYSWSSPSMSMQTTDPLSTENITFLLYNIATMFSQPDFHHTV